MAAHIERISSGLIDSPLKLIFPQIPHMFYDSRNALQRVLVTVGFSAHGWPLSESATFNSSRHLSTTSAGEINSRQSPVLQVA
jgi:hypothetical protein